MGLAYHTIRAPPSLARLRRTAAISSGITSDLTVNHFVMAELVGHPRVRFLGQVLGQDMDARHKAGRDDQKAGAS
jgi:hypothetical protein